MPAQKKVWVFGGAVAQYPSVLVDGSVHGGRSCTDCHAGVDDGSTPVAPNESRREIAHVGRKAMPNQSACSGCHTAVVAAAGKALHANIGGFYTVLAKRGFDFTDGSVSRVRFEKQCAKCHTADAERQFACGQCHLSVPNTAGGGLIAGHQFRRRPSMDNNCTACHGSRVKDEYYGLNNELLERNKQAFPADSPWKTAHLAADVHKTAGKDCTFCHAGSEMHGSGAPTAGDRYDVEYTRNCTDCHQPSQSVVLHMFPKHLTEMACQVCHSQQYKHCYGCHTQEKNGAGYFVTNESDPTRLARLLASLAAWSKDTTYAKDAKVKHGDVPYVSLAADNRDHEPGAAASGSWWKVDTSRPAGDALITFRAGRNPRYGEPGMPKYSVLRHVPIDGDVFTYTIEGTQAAGLVPQMTALPTWKYATPHNIQRVTPIQSACDNCHGAAYGKFWLTDPIGDSLGWVGAPYAADEQSANAGVKATAPVDAPWIP